jgi:hypothetical protein
LHRLKAIAIGAALMALASPAFAEWMTIKNEPDPFEPSKSTFIAGTVDIHAGTVGLVIRCLQGGLSLVVTNSGSNAARGDPAHLKIVADSRPPPGQDEASVISSTAELTVVQFGDEATVGYLKGAKKVSVRYTIGGTTLTETFDGGESLDDVIQKALKACGKSSEPQASPPSVAALAAGKAASNQTADWYYRDGNEDGAECHAISGTPKQFADAAVREGATNLETTGWAPGTPVARVYVDVVISYGLKDKSYLYYFYKSHEKCANPSGDADNTRSDFGRISHDVDADQDKAEQTLPDEALKHATDKGPWWLSNGTKMNAGCKLSQFTPMGDALSAKAKGARNIEIEGLGATNVRHPTDVVVKYDLNDKLFFNDYYPNKFCDDRDPPSQSDKAKAISVSSRNGESWYVDYFSDNVQCVETNRSPKELADEAKRHDATDIEFAVPSSDDEKTEKTFLSLQYGVGDQGHWIAFYKARDACTAAIKH